MGNLLSSMFAARAPEVRRAQIENSYKLSPVAALGGTFNALVASLTLWSSGRHAEISAWFVFIVGLAWLRMRQFRDQQRSGFDALDLDRTQAALWKLAIVSGVAWGGGIAAAAAFATAQQFNLLAMLCGGMMGAAVLTFGPLPRAGIAYVVPMSIGCAIAWIVAPSASAWAGVPLVVSYAVFLSRTILSNERLLIAKVESDTALRESAETVQLLLNDYEAQSADWLWSSDAEGRICDASERFADASGLDCASLQGMPIADLFEPNPEREILLDHIAAQCAFRRITLQLMVDGIPHWWTLSAQPRGDGGMRGVASDVTAQKRAEERVSYMAHYDGLTDLANRFLFVESLSRCIKRLRDKDEAAVLCLDLDQFKSVNDTLGHPVGDKLLTEAARRIEAAVRDTDLVARLGGDEFAVLIRNLHHRRDAELCAQRIIEALEQPFVLDGMQVMTSASIGIATATHADSSAADLLKKADLALYCAKTNGRNRFAHFEPGMDDAARERRELEMDLRGALVRSEFELHYQPLLNIESGKIVSYEALVRWNHPQRGIIMPDTFIPLAEETGLIVQIGEWVIRQATMDVAKWPDQLRVSINLSPAQMRSANLISTVVSAVSHAGIDAGRVELEITETVLMHDTAINIAILHKLRNIGVRISLDDFGTGYSSLNYLRSFPFDKIKIDRCFVEDIDEREDCQAIVRAVTGLANSLGMVTTAEGVERTEQLDKLRSEGCTEVQGYLFSRPERVEALSDLRQRHDKSVSGKSAATPVPMLPACEIAPAAKQPPPQQAAKQPRPKKRAAGQ